ncbi:glycosyl hydrolase [Flavobacterium sp. 5]|uniref:glycosyl hydrolase n=1 Tax=Flavobacterium sp. 5 TaxID=2035199 RepID=UPI000C2C14C3|nr:glycosyl hydrolase [Flavobacterium sp. 5]PKB15517.1 putative glycosyl hydrolase [Flavobacterium sp. 5]
MKLFNLKLICLATVSLFCSCSKSDSEDNSTDNYTPKQEVFQKRSTKRGGGFNYQNINDVNLLGKGMSWSYNWGISQNIAFDDAVAKNDIDFCPMAWNGINKDALRSYVKDHPKCKYLLAFNEPNLTDQANMTPQQAAAKWGDVKSIADELGLKVISPAMNYGTLANYSNPVKWLDEFFALVPLSDIDGISIHCYMPNAASVKSYVQLFKKYGKPIWLTEFCAWDGLNKNTFAPEGQQKHLSDVINYLESDPDVFRYAWFTPRVSNIDAFPYMALLTNTPEVKLTDLGKIFVQMSTQDKSAYYVEQQLVEAEHYSSISIADGGNGSWVNGPHVKITTDAPNESLELYDFLPKQWVEYQFDIDRTKDFTLELRYSCFVDSEINIEVDGKLGTTFLLKNTVKDFIWSNAKVPVKLNSGKHTIRIFLNKGSLHLNWLKIY